MQGKDCGEVAPDGCWFAPGCGGRGTCVNGFCHCRPGYWGIGCGRSTPTLGEPQPWVLSTPATTLSNASIAGGGESLPGPGRGQGREGDVAAVAAAARAVAAASAAVEAAVQEALVGKEGDAGWGGRGSGEGTGAGTGVGAAPTSDGASGAAVALEVLDKR